MLTLEEMVNPRNAAVLVIDIQNDFCHPEGGVAKKGVDVSLMMGVVPNIVNLVDQGRRAKVPIIFIRTGHTRWTRSEAWVNKNGDIPNLCEEGSWGAQLYRITPLPDERVVVKYRFSGFIGTNLDLVLRNAGVKTVIMSGVTTNTCVESTARQAFMMDYNVVFLSDCTAARSKEFHEATLQNIRMTFGFVRTSTDLFKLWSRYVPAGAKVTEARD
ncbi:MAG: cysteine hydrolase [Chloroflexi bacterium]|nr:cysteine hydrolase [Chloroflexota bacterium]